MYFSAVIWTYGICIVYARMFPFLRCQFLTREIGREAINTSLEFFFLSLAFLSLCSFYCNADCLIIVVFLIFFFLCLLQDGPSFSSFDDISEDPSDGTLAGGLCLISSSEGEESDTEIIISSPGDVDYHRNNSSDVSASYLVSNGLRMRTKQKG